MSHFQSPEFLVRQTRENLSEFDAAVSRFFEENRGRRVVEVDPQTRQKTFKVVFGADPPERLRYIGASLITDMRHALDQAVCAAVELITGADPGLIYFPIAANAKDLAGKVAKFPPEIRDTLLGFQCYPTGQGAAGGNDIICQLSKAAQRKHRVSCKVGGKVISIGGRSGGRIDLDLDGGRWPIFPEWNVDKNEMILAVTGPNGYFNNNLKISFYIAFYDAGPLTGFPVVETGNVIVETVSKILTDLDAASARSAPATSQG